MPTVPDPLHRRPPVLSPGSGVSLPVRVSGLAAWMQARGASGLAPGEVRLTSGVDAWMEVQEADGRIREGLNFTSCDHLGLCGHRDVREAAAGALLRFGPHSAGPAATAGLHVLAEPLCAGLAELTGLREVTAMPSGWAAGYGAMRALVGRDDVVLLDAHAGGAMREGARAAGAALHPFRHTDLNHLAQRLSRLRAARPRALIVVATPALFPHDGATPELLALRRLTRDYAATLVIDVGQDLGCTGPGGRGELGLQGVDDLPDVIVGSLARTFASNGGFVATGSAELARYLRHYSPAHAGSAALSPPQLAAATAAVRIVRSAEGAARRAALQRAAITLRTALARPWLRPDSPGPILALTFPGEAVAPVAAWLCGEEGVLVTPLDPPNTVRGTSALRLHLMATHEPALLTEVARVLTRSLESGLKHAHSLALRHE